MSKAAQLLAAAVQVSAPADGATVRRGHVMVRGTVTPETASVEVLGLRAAVSNGVFSRAVPVQPGANSIDVVASGPGITPSTTTVTVTRAQDPKPAATTKTTSVGQSAAPAEVRVPSVAGERLDVAELDLGNAGLTYTEVGGGAFGIIVKSNWQVCQTQPSPGTRAASGSTVALIVARPEEC